MRRKKQREEESIRFMNEMKVMAGDGLKQTEAVETFGSQVNKLNKVAKSQQSNKSDARLRRHARGEAEITFTPKKEKKQRKVQFRGDTNDEADPEKDAEGGRTKQRFQGRRIASRNAFRGM